MGIPQEEQGQGSPLGKWLSFHRWQWVTPMWHHLPASKERASPPRGWTVIVVSGVVFLIALMLVMVLCLGFLSRSPRTKITSLQPILECGVVFLFALMLVRLFRLGFFTGLPWTKITSHMPILVCGVLFLFTLMLVMLLRLGSFSGSLRTKITSIQPILECGVVFLFAMMLVMSFHVGFFSDVPWTKITSDNPILVCGVVFLLDLMLVILLRLGFFSGLPGTKIMPMQPTALDIMGHPSWPTMKDKLGDVLADTMKQGEITSFFQDQKASSHDMNQQIDQYLYMAIVYAAVLRAHYDGTADISEKVVRHQAELYLHSMLKRTKQYALPSMEGASSLEHVTGEMNRYLYSTIVQANVLVTIMPTPPVPRATPPVPDVTPPGHGATPHVPIVPTPSVPDVPKPSVPDVPKPSVPQPDDVDKDEKIRKLEKLIKELRTEITTLQKQKDSCCQRANRCENKVKELGGSVDDDETYFEEKKVYYDQVKEISSLK